MKTCTKRWSGFPFAHRAPNHKGHCRFIHGHNWDFKVTFGCDEVDECGFVVDFGGLKPLKQKLDDFFDHTLLLNHADPLLEDCQKFLTAMGLNNVRAVVDCSCEGIAEQVFRMCDGHVRYTTKNRARVVEVRVYEDAKNSATVTQ